MEDFEIKKMIDDAINKFSQQQQYGVKRNPYHIHNGIDSPFLPYTSIQNYQQYRFLTRTTLTTGQVKALHTTPVILVPAQSGAVIIVEGIVGLVDFKGTAYAGANALEFRYTDASGAKVTADISTTFLNSGTDALASVAGVTTELVPVYESPITVSIPVANPTNGDSPITFVVHYRIVPFNI